MVQAAVLVFIFGSERARLDAVRMRVALASISRTQIARIVWGPEFGSWLGYTPPPDAESLVNNLRECLYLSHEQAGCVHRNLYQHFHSHLLLKDLPLAEVDIQQASSHPD